jgi:hypothetical protein
MQRAILLLAGLIGILGSTSVRGDESVPVVAVFDIENRGSPLSGEQMTTLTDYLATKLGEGGKFRIIPRAKLRERLRGQKEASHKACYDQSCQIEIGKELAAGFTVSTAIARMGKTCLITANIYDLKKAATARTATGKAPCQVDALVGEMEKVAEKLLGIEPPPRPPPRPPPGPAPDSPLANPPTYTPPAKKDEPPDNFLELQVYMVTFSHLSGREPLEGAYSGVALGLIYDRRLSDLFTLGFTARYYSDGGMLDAAVRPGLLLRLSRRWLVLTYLHFGYVYASELFEDESYDPYSSHGTSMRAGASLKWLLFDSLGVTLDMVFGAVYANIPDLDDDSWRFEFNFSFGGVFAW